MTTKQSKKPTCRNVEALPLCPRPRQGISFVNAPSRTDQKFKNECDINQIMKRYYKEGVITHVNRNAPMYGEVPACDFQEAIALVEGASNMFEELPAKLRQHFENDPVQFLEFMEKPENREEGVLMGLLAPEDQTAARGAATPAAEPETASSPAEPSGD